MTLQQAKDQVAREKNFKDWVDMLARDHYTNIELRHDKAAELYARSKEKEGFDAGFKRGLAENNRTQS